MTYNAQLISQNAFGLFELCLPAHSHYSTFVLLSQPQIGKRLAGRHIA